MEHAENSSESNFELNELARLVLIHQSGYYEIIVQVLHVLS